MQGPIVDPASQPSIPVPSHEGLVEVTPEVIDAIRNQPFMTIEQLGAWIVEHHESDSFRLQTRNRYIVPSDETDFQRYLDGAAAPDREAKQGWLNWLTEVKRTGKAWRNLHIVDQWTPYMGFICEWCYIDNEEFGATNRILDLSETQVPQELLQFDDFYLVDGHAAVVAYDRAGHYLYALPVDKPDRLADARDLLWDAGTPFTEWWARHPEHHRSHHRAA